MAAKRISQSSINWAALSERVPPPQKAQFLAFKSRSDKYLRAMLANPEQSPKIDWAAYKRKIPNAALVDSFQKAYETLKVPYPVDTQSAEVDKMRAEVTSQIAAFKKESEQRIAENKANMERIKGLLPYAQMTIEEYFEAHPELALKPLENPTFWPHDPDIQPGACEDEKDEHH